MTGSPVLIVEDDGLIAFHLMEMLRGAGYAVEDPFFSAEEALRRLGRSPRPGLVILEAGIPGRSPRFLEARRICSLHKIPLVVLTSFAGYRSERLPGIQREIFIVKPFSRQDILSGIREATRAGQCITDPGTGVLRSES